MSKKLTSALQLQKSQLLLVILGCSLLGAGIVGVSQAKHGVGSGANNGGTNASISGVSSCPGGVWTVQASALSNVAVLLPVDIYDTINSTGARLLQSNVYLDRVTPYTFQFTPSPGRDDILFITVHSSGAPLTTRPNETLVENRLVNPCV